MIHHKMLTNHIDQLDQVDALSFKMNVEDARGLVVEFNELKYHIIKLEEAVLKWCNRPTKDGAKNLRESLSGLVEESQKYRFEYVGGKWKANQ